MKSLSLQQADWPGGLLLLAALALALLGAVSLPLALFFTFSMFALLQRQTLPHGLWVFAALMCIALVLNITKKPYNDWAWYSYHYTWLRVLPFSQYIGTHFDQFTIKASEPVYYFIASTLAKLTGGRVEVLAAFVTLWVYAPVVAVVCAGFAGFRSNSVARLSLELTALLAGISFTLTLHLVRQEVAASFLMWGYLLYRRGHGRIGLLVSAIAAFTHNSAAAPLALFVGSHWLQHRFSGARAVIGAALWGGLLGGAILVSSIHASYYADGRSDGSLSAITVAFDLLLGLSLYLLVRSGRLPAALHRPEQVFLVAMAAMLVMLLPLPIPFLRMYFYFEGVRVVLLCLVLGAVIKREAVITPATVFLLALLIFTLRVWRSPFEFGQGVLQELFLPRWSPWADQILSLIGPWLGNGR